MCILGIIYSSVACFAQVDMKKIIAYSSIGHMNTATIALFTNDYHGISAGVYFLISHGLISSALFLLIGVLYDRYHTRTIKYYRGLVLIMPVYTVLFLIFSLANVAVPGTSGFISEFLTFLGAMNLNPFIAVSASIAIVLAPAYALWFFHRVSYGSYSTYLTSIYQDVTAKELHLLLPLLFFTFLLGIYPQFIFEPLHLSCLSLLHYLSYMSLPFSLIRLLLQVYCSPLSFLMITFSLFLTSLPYYSSRCQLP
jgi:NADH:ubiquinone oxidoreductase subunit 4 (subunit M)